MGDDEALVEPTNSKDYLKASLYELLAVMHHLISLFPRKIGKEKVPVLAFYMAIVELVDGMALLYSEGKLNQIPNLLRSAIDSLYDLKLLNEDLKNINLLYAKAIHEQIKVYELQLDPASDNPNIKSDPERIIRIKDNLRKSRDTLEGLKRGGYTLKRHSEKYVTLSGKYFHGIVFSQLSAEVHNSIDVLIRRHIVLRPETSVQLKYQQMHEPKKYQQAFFDIAMVALDSTCLVRKMLEVEFHDPLNRMLGVVSREIGQDMSKFNWYGYEE